MTSKTSTQVKYQILKLEKLTVREIRALLGCGKRKALNAMHEIHSLMLNSGVRPKFASVSRYWFCLYAGWNWQDIECRAIAELNEKK